MRAICSRIGSAFVNKWRNQVEKKRKDVGGEGKKKLRTTLSSRGGASRDSVERPEKSDGNTKGAVKPSLKSKGSL